MKHMLRVGFLLLVLCLATGLFAQVTAIHDIQFTEDASGDSPMKDQTVTISGIITGETYAFSGLYGYFIQDASEPWSGVWVYDKNRDVAEGDSVTLTGKVAEYNGLTEITSVSAFSIDKEGVFGIDPLVVTTNEVGTSESLEGCLVTVNDVDITNPALGYGEWQINDGSGPCVVDNVGYYFFDPANYTSVASITGPVYYDYGFYKIRPRLANDIVESGPYTRIQRFQQVRYSDLMKAGEDDVSDKSYMKGDTVTIHGIVTGPSGLFYAGDGVKFVLEEANGGPWSAVQSYNPVGSAYPELFIGDEIAMTGYIDEYATSPGNMTEMWITAPIEDIISVDNPVPPVDTISTGDLRWPTTAEQWGTVFVAVKQATVVDNNPPSEPYGVMAVDDGTGSVWIDHDSDSLYQYYYVDKNPPPALGTVYSSIKGWVYHHYGDYSDSSAYKLAPLYREDMVLGQAPPPSIADVLRDKAAPTSSETVTVTCEVSSMETVTAVTLHYQVGVSAVAKALIDYTDLAMTNIGDEAWSVEVPAQANNSVVSYYITAEDNLGQSTTMPSNFNQTNYCYVVKDGAISIKDVQYTPWSLGNSPFNNYEVEVTGIVTTDTANYGKFEAYVIQDAEGPWNGIFAFGDMGDLMPGDQVKVKGTVSEANPDWLYKWGSNTVILADDVEVLSSGNALPAAVEVTTGVLANSGADAESYEGSLVNVKNVTFTRINSYDISVDDGSGECLVDGDFLVGSDVAANPYVFFDAANQYMVVGGTDTIRIGDQIKNIVGVYTYSFGTYKISLRNLADIGGTTGVRNAVEARPLAFNLEQNYPNPFNAGTCIRFELAQAREVQLIVYNVFGQKVMTLVNKENYAAGTHTVFWDGTVNGVSVPSGMYIYRIKAGDFLQHKKMTLLK